MVGCVCMCVLHLVVTVCSLEELHIWMDYSLSLSLSSPHHVRVFSVSFHVDWLLLLFLHPSIFLFFLSFSLPTLPPLSVWCVFDWEGCQPLLIGLLLHLMLADWLVLLTSGDVMRSWLAVRNFCMNSSIDVFLHCVQMMNMQLNSPSFSLLFSEGSNIMVLDFFLNAFVLKYFVVFFVPRANGCIVLSAKLPDYSPGSLFSMSFSFKRSACINYHRCSSTELTSVITKRIMTPHSSVCSIWKLLNTYCVSGNMFSFRKHKSNLNINQTLHHFDPSSILVYPIKWGKLASDPFFWCPGQ